MSTSSTTHRPDARAAIDLTGDPDVDTSPPPFEGGPDGPLQTIRISGVTFSEREVEVVVRDGIAYFEGDIRLGPVPGQPAADDPGEKAVVVTGTGVRWPNAVIPYVIDGSLAGNTNVTAAIAHWNSLTPIRMVQRDPATHSDFVVIKSTSDTSIGGASDIGHGPGQRSIVINASGSNAGTVIHEIGHTVGLWHEQSREDRDGYVTINLANVQAGKQSQFNQHIVDGDDSGPYDYGSIMHYPRDAFEVPGTGDTITPKQPGVTIGQRTALSRGDIEAVFAMYAPDPLPGPAIVAGQWATIRSGHVLVSLPQRVLDWEPATGHYRLWRYDPAIAGVADPLPGAPVTEGTWQTVRTGHELIVLGPDRVLDWEPATGHHRIWRFDPNATGSADPLPGPAISEGTWQTIRTGHRLIPLGGNRVLDWEPANGHLRIWNYDQGFTGSGDPFPGQAVVDHTWTTIRSGHELLPLGPDRVLDWEPATGHYRVWAYDPSIGGGGDPLPGQPTTQGTWSTVQAGHQLTFLPGGGRVLDWQPATGQYRVWRIR
jgi:hypothetical protein